MASMNTIYWVENGQLVSKEIENSTKVDGHVHSRYSGIKPDNFVGTPVTKFMGVRESYAKPKKMHWRLKGRGMGLCTVMDHDSVLGAIEMRQRYPEDTFVNCEYTVLVDAEKAQTIHIGVWGIDYPEGTKRAISSKEVLNLHYDLLREAKKGYNDFVDFCNMLDIPCVFNHPAWQGAPKNRFSGKQFEELLDKFRYYEINGDHNLENFVALHAAMEKPGKIICAGSDSHYYRRMGRQFTAARKRVDTPYEFLQAFKKGEIGIGSRLTMPKSIQNPTEKDILNKFKGTIWDLQMDTLSGFNSYFPREWGWQKQRLLAIMFGTPALASYFLGAKFSFSAWASFLALVFAIVPAAMPAKERLDAAHGTIALDKSHRTYLAELEAAPIKKTIEGLEEKKEIEAWPLKERIEQLEKAKEHLAATVEKKEEIINQTIGDLETRVEQIRQKHALPADELEKELKGLTRVACKIIQPFKIFRNNYNPADKLTEIAKKNKGFFSRFGIKKKG